MIKDILKCIPFCKIIIYCIAFYVLCSIFTGCAAVRSTLYWYEHSENMRMPDHIENNMIGPDHTVNEESK